ncbi:fimbrial protein [Cupriavidus agavae]|uniref:Major type 1 subunit fimbrin (Pilin) n=1 Tax=Cupriavidus agavae TaxID=1001822 RepID=A0A4Q7S911_9BURK|nr:type 1 fimbrial protein [Cupriavidus agavae]RZT42956.1 major type 1 subunit fimbrin (pilin) [Cupriavidus agavae]
MKHLKATLCAAAATLATMAPQAFAADGTITFTGAVSGQTCTVNGSTSGSDFTVALPAVRAASLDADGDTAGRTPFTIALTSCNPTTGTVAVHFETGANTDVVTGRLRNTVVTTAATETAAAVTGAGNVQVGLLNADQSAIVLGAAFGAQNSQTVALASGAANLQYYAQYVATGAAATAGTLSTSTTYTIVYP